MQRRGTRTTAKASWLPNVGLGLQRMSGRGVKVAVVLGVACTCLLALLVLNSSNGKHVAHSIGSAHKEMDMDRIIHEVEAYKHRPNPALAQHEALIKQRQQPVHQQQQNLHKAAVELRHLESKKNAKKATTKTKKLAIKQDDESDSGKNASDEFDILSETNDTIDLNSSDSDAADDMFKQQKHEANQSLSLNTTHKSDVGDQEVPHPIHVDKKHNKGSAPNGEHSDEKKQDRNDSAASAGHPQKPKADSDVDAVNTTNATDDTVMSGHKSAKKVTKKEKHTSKQHASIGVNNGTKITSSSSSTTTRHSTTKYTGPTVPAEPFFFTRVIPHHSLEAPQDKRVKKHDDKKFQQIVGIKGKSGPGTVYKKYLDAAQIKALRGQQRRPRMLRQIQNPLDALNNNQNDLQMNHGHDGQQAPDKSRNNPNDMSNIHDSGHINPNPINNQNIKNKNAELENPSGILGNAHGASYNGDTKPREANNPVDGQANGIADNRGNHPKNNGFNGDPNQPNANAVPNAGSAQGNIAQNNVQANNQPNQQFRQGDGGQIQGNYNNGQVNPNNDKTMEVNINADKLNQPIQAVENNDANLKKLPPANNKEGKDDIKANLANRNVPNHLICVISPDANVPTQIPNEYCTHLVYREVIYDDVFKTYRPRHNNSVYKAFQSLAEQEGNKKIKLFVALDDKQFRTLYQNARAEAVLVLNMAKTLSKWLVDKDYDGVAVFNIPIPNDVSADLLHVLWRLQEMFQKQVEGKPQLMVGAILNDALSSNLTNKQMIKHLHDIDLTSDVMILQTHYAKPQKECRTTYPSMYAPFAEQETSTPMKKSFLWLNTLIEKTTDPKKLCFSLNMAALSFEVQDDFAHAGAPCVAEKWISYKDACVDSKNVAPQEDLVVGSSYRHRPNQWISFDSETAIRTKVSKAMEGFHSICVAAFFVDFDDYDGQCHDNIAFPRLKAIRYEQVQHAAEHDKPMTAVRRPVIDDRGRAGRRSNFSKPLICILSIHAMDQDAYPKDFCSHIVFRDVIYYPEHHSLHARERDTGIETLKKVRTLTNIKLLVNLEPNYLLEFHLERLTKPNVMKEFATGVGMWLNKHGLDGLSILYQNVTPPDVHIFNALLRHLRIEFDKFPDKLEVIFGAAVQNYDRHVEDVAELFEDMARSVNYLIFETHHTHYQANNAAQCKITYPSVFRRPSNAMPATVPIENTVRWMRLLHHNRTNNKMCFSLNMVVINYRIAKRNAVFCQNEEWTSYREACTSGGFNQLEFDSESLAYYRIHQDTYQTYETEAGIRQKVIKARSMFPGVCVAAYNVDFDDLEGSCTGRKLARLSAIADAMSVTVEDRGRSGGDRDATTTTKKPVPKSANKLICVVSDMIKLPTQIPQELCNMTIYKELLYDANKHEMMPHKDRSKAFAAFETHRNYSEGAYLVGITEEEINKHLANATDALSVAHFVSSTTNWLSRNGWQGIAFLEVDIMKSNAKFNEMLAKFSDAMRHAPVTSMRVVLTARVNPLYVADYLKKLSEIGRYVDVLVLQTHHVAEKKRECRSMFTSRFKSHKDDLGLLPISMAFDAMGHASAAGFGEVCFSLSMAAMKFKLTASDKNVHTGGASCEKQQLEHFKQTCARKSWSSVAVDDQSLTSYHYQDTMWESFEDPENVVKKTRLALKKNPKVCVAAFNVELEDEEGRCDPEGAPYPRLMAIRKALDRVKITSSGP